jgi:O-antigen ligase
VNLGGSTISLLVLGLAALAGWFIASMAGWSRPATAAGAAVIIVLLGGLQMWRVAARQRSLMKQGRWPPDRPHDAAYTP